MVEVNGVNEINEEEVRYEQVEGALGGRIIKTQEDGTQKMVALRDNDRDTMHDVESGGGWRMQEEDTNVEFRILQELDEVDPNATIRLTSILALPQMVSIPQRSRDTPFMDYSKSISWLAMSIAALEHKQERQEEVAQEKEKKKVNLEITKN